MKRHFEKGFNLIELIVAMAIFSIVIVLIGTSFSTILKYSSQFMKNEESNIEGNVGLEIFRHDIEAAGFGLPTSFPPGVNPIYTEATDNNLTTKLNDAGLPVVVPRAFVGLAGNSTNSSNSMASSISMTNYSTVGGSDYLALKGSSLGTQAAAKKWTYMSYSSIPAPPKTWSSGNLVNGDQVIVLQRTFGSTGVPNSQLVFNPATPSVYWTTYASTGLGSVFAPPTSANINYIYGIAGSGTNLRMPFNRADYFVAKPSSSGSKPAYCAPNTGILYKALVSHADGTLQYEPLLDCVARMQVVLGWNMLDASGNLITNSTTTGSGVVDTWTNADGTIFSSSGPVTSMVNAVSDAGFVRSNLKTVTIYILAQNGKYDPNYSSAGASSFNLYDVSNGGGSVGSVYTLTSNMLNYRWKLYKLVIRPKNLQSNQ